MASTEHMQSSVILFDGFCNLCSNTVQFIIKRDKKDTFKFASLQSPFGQSVLKKYQLSDDYLKTFILLQDGKVFTKSTGALMVSRKLSGIWPALYFFIIVPSFIRNFIYNIVSKYRYAWFGKKEICWIPTKEMNSKFLVE